MKSNKTTSVFRKALMFSRMRRVFEFGIAIKNTKNSHICRILNKQSKFNKSADNLRRPPRVVFTFRQMHILLRKRQREIQAKGLEFDRHH